VEVLVTVEAPTLIFREVVTTFVSLIFTVPWQAASSHASFTPRAWARTVIFENSTTWAAAGIVVVVVVVVEVVVLGMVVATMVKDCCD
jgi:hypothetical protein